MMPHESYVFSDNIEQVVDLANAFVSAGTETTFEGALARALVEFEPAGRLLAIAKKGRSRLVSGAVSGEVGTVAYTVQEDEHGRRFQVMHTRPNE